MRMMNQRYRGTKPGPRNNVVFYFLPLRFLGPSLPEASPPLVSASLVTTPLFLVFFRWCSGIHSSSYPPEPVVVVATGALASEGMATLGFLDLGKNERKVK